MHIRITTNISQSKKLLNLERALIDLKPPLNKFGMEYQKIIDERFESEGSNYEPWEKSKSAIRRNGLTLTDKRDLRKSFQRNKTGNVFEISNNKLVFGSTYRVNGIGIARLHHYGSRNMKAWGKKPFILIARKILVITPQVRTQFKNIMKEHIKNALK